MLKNVTLIGNIWHVILGAQDRCRIYPGRCAFFGSELRTVFFVANRRHSAAVCPVWKRIWYFAWDFGESCPVKVQLRFKCPAPPHAWQAGKSQLRSARDLEVGDLSFKRKFLPFSELNPLNPLKKLCPKLMEHCFLLNNFVNFEDWKQECHLDLF